MIPAPARKSVKANSSQMMVMPAPRMTSSQITDRRKTETSAFAPALCLRCLKSTSAFPSVGGAAFGVSFTSVRRSVVGLLVS